jgi:MFS transporter, DHA1 family, multidrug resistance protein
MEPVGHIAGTASSIQGFVTTVGGAAIGAAIGQAYDGSTLPVASGYLLLGFAALAVVFVTEGMRLFEARAVPSPQVP